MSVFFYILVELDQGLKCKLNITYFSRSLLDKIAGDANISLTPKRKLRFKKYGNYEGERSKTRVGGLFEFVWKTAVNLIKFDAVALVNLPTIPS